MSTADPAENAEPAPARSSGWLARLVAAALTALNLFLGFVLVAHRGPDRWGELIGGTTAPIVIALLVVLVTRPLARTRTSLAPLRVYNWTLSFVLLSSVVQIFQRVGQSL